MQHFLEKIIYNIKLFLYNNKNFLKKITTFFGIILFLVLLLRIFNFDNKVNNDNEISLIKTKVYEGKLYNLYKSNEEEFLYVNNEEIYKETLDSTENSIDFFKYNQNFYIIKNIGNIFRLYKIENKKAKKIYEIDGYFTYVETLNGIYMLQDGILRKFENDTFVAIDNVQYTNSYIYTDGENILLAKRDDEEEIKVYIWKGKGFEYIAKVEKLLRPLAYDNNRLYFLYDNIQKNKNKSSLLGYVDINTKMVNIIDKIAGKNMFIYKTKNDLILINKTKDNYMIMSLKTNEIFNQSKYKLIYPLYDLAEQRIYGVVQNKKGYDIIKLYE